MSDREHNQHLAQTWGAFVERPDEERFRVLHDAAAPLVWTICHRLLRREEDARDAMQATWVRLFLLAQHPDIKKSFHPQHTTGSDLYFSTSRNNTEVEKFTSDPVSLISRTAAREADALRKRLGRRARKEAPMGDLTSAMAQGPSPADEAAARETRARLETLVQTLPDKYRVPVLLHYFDGLTQAQIAAMLGMTTAGVSLRLKRALRKLNPLARRAGLGEAPAALGGTLAGAALLSPPAVATAGAAWVGVEAALATGASLGVGAILAGSAQSGLAAALLKFKLGIAAVILGGAAIVALPLFDPAPPEPPRPVVSAMMVPATEPAPQPAIAMQPIAPQDALTPEEVAWDTSSTPLEQDESSLAAIDTEPSMPIDTAEPRRATEGLAATLTNLPGQVLGSGPTATTSGESSETKSHKVTARLEFDKPIAPKVLAKYQFATLRRTSRNWWNFLGREGANLTDEASVLIQNGQMEFRGRFRGKYFLDIGFESGTITYLQKKHEFKINNLRGDEDLGAIRLPAMAGVGVRVILDVSSLDYEPTTDHATVVFIDPVRKIVVHTLYTSIGHESSDAHVLAIPPGDYIVFVHANGWRMQGEAPRLQLMPAEGPVPAITARMKPVGFIQGWAKQGEGSSPYIHIQPDRVTLKGPDGLVREAVQNDTASITHWPPGYTNLWKGEDYLISSEFAFNDLPAGEYVITIEAQGYAPMIKTVTVHSGARTHVPSSLERME